MFNTQASLYDVVAWLDQEAQATSEDKDALQCGGEGLFSFSSEAKTVHQYTPRTSRTFEAWFEV